MRMRCLATKQNYRDDPYPTARTAPRDSRIAVKGRQRTQLRNPNSDTGADRCTTLSRPSHTPYHNMPLA